MMINNQTPFSCEVVPYEMEPEKQVLLTLLKATYTFAPGVPLQLAAEQLPIWFHDEFFDPEEGRLPRYESDIVAAKPYSDILLHGTAYTPNRYPAKAIAATLQVGTLEKSLYVFGDRYWRVRGGSVIATDPVPFTSMPITFERAYGGADRVSGDSFAKNPVGKGYISGKSVGSIDQVALPNIEHPKRLLQHWHDHPHPAGYGVIGKGWKPRCELLGTYDAQWLEQRSPLPPLDFSREFFNLAQADQQMEGFLVGDEPVVLTNLTPEGKTSFALPGVRPKITVTDSRFDSAEEAVRRISLGLDTLIIEPDLSRVILIWRTTTPLADLDDLAYVTVTINPK